MDTLDLDRLAELIATELVARTERAGPGGAEDRQAEGPPPEAENDSPQAQTAGHPRAAEEPGVPPPVWNQPIAAITPPPDNQIAAREAAARRAPDPLAGVGTRRLRPIRVDVLARRVPIGVAAHELLLSDEDWRTLFGSASPTLDRPLRQPGKVVYGEVVRVVGPAGELTQVPVLGPFRERSRLALARSEAHRLGLEPPIGLPGDFPEDFTARVIGPAGSVAVPAVVSAAHVYLDSGSAARLGIEHGRRVHVRCAGAGRAITLHDVPVFVGAHHAAELCIDIDEANAAGVQDGDLAFIVDPATLIGAGLPPRQGRRPLLTERDVDAVAARGEVLSPKSPYLITPAARDRARYLGIWREH